MDNCVASTKKLLYLNSVRYTKRFIEDKILAHPDHPSLLSIVDTLEKYDIESLGVDVNSEKLAKLPLPAIVQVSHEKTTKLFVLKEYSEKNVVYFDDQNRKVKTSKDEFLELWTGVCLLAEKTRNSKEPGIKKKLSSRRIFESFLITGIAFMLIWIVSSFVKSDFSIKSGYLISGSYFFLKLIGLASATALMWLEVDFSNPTLQNFCSGGKKLNCSLVLSSKYARIFNGYISLSIIGFCYFLSSTLLLIGLQFSSISYGILGVISLLTAPMVLASIFYQAVILKQWCKFCLIVQAVLALEIMISLIGNLYLESISFESLMLFLGMALLIIAIWKVLQPLIDYQKERHFYKRKVQKIKAIPKVFESYLLKSPKIIEQPIGLGINLGKKDAKYHIVKVCNPFCGPCAASHEILEKLLKKGNISLQILYMAKRDTSEIATKVVQHFLAIDDDKKIETSEALDNWYLAQKKDYASFAKRYPLNGELKKQMNKVDAMDSWCSNQNILYTPTIFVNGYQLPTEYSPEELLDLLN